MQFTIQTYQNTFWALIGLLCLCMAVAVIAGVSLASRVLSGRYESKPLPRDAFRGHKRFTIIAVAVTAAVLLFLFALLPDCRMQIVNDDTADVLTVTGQVEAIQPRSLLDGTLLFRTEDGFTFGTELTVSGRAYHAICADGLTVGETVTLQYLPRSRCVLYLGDGSSLPYPAMTAEGALAAQEAAIAAAAPVKTMRFPYEDYVRCFTVEALLFVAITIILLRMLVLCVIRLVRRKLTAQEGVTSVVALVIMAHLLMVGCSSVWGGQWQLLLEKPQDAVQAQGVITSIEILDSQDGVKFSTEWGTHFGCLITIDDETCFGMYEGDLAVGDTVTLEYLPKSRCVTSIAPLT